MKNVHVSSHNLTFINQLKGSGKVKKDVRDSIINNQNNLGYQINETPLETSFDD